MKKKTVQKLHLEKIKIANLSATKQQTTKGQKPTLPESVCICSWPTENL
ncbi:hypothetical protein SAMN05518672_103746 [Chitinophaga sp. CF118]|nr:hypothetical protein [Chitinophaga sp. CF118]SFD89544.1 hypothetical protein SAMN05518672_103746 [Chitinophaga sp. CF118]